MTTQRIKPPATSNATSTSNSTSTVTYQQSLELMKTMVLISTSNIMLGRSLFPERAFERRLFKPKSDDTSFSYDGFLKQPVVDQAQARRLKQNKGLACLERGTLDPADTFLKWLETSVFEAMERKVLKAFQLRVFEDKENPDNVLETWTFMTTYPDELGGAAQVGNIELQRRGGQAVTVANARENLTETVKSIAELTNHMKYLPIERYLGLFLWYKDDCDPDYLPAGFEDCVLGDINFPTDGAYQVRSKALRPYQDGVHGFQVATTYVDDVVPVTEEDEPEKLPSGLPYKHVRGPDADIQMLEAPTTSGQGEAEPPTSSQHKHQFAASSRVVPSTSEEDASLDDRGEAASISQSDLQEDIIMTATDSANGMSQLVDAPVAQVRELSIDDDSMLWSQHDRPQASVRHSQLSVQEWDATETQKLQHMVRGVAASQYPGGSTQPRRAGAQDSKQHVTSAKKTLPSGNVTVSQRMSPHTPRACAVAAEGHNHAESNEEAQNSVQPLYFRRDVLDDLERRRRVREKDSAPSEKDSAPSATGRQTRARASQGGETTTNKCECGTTQIESDMLECVCCGQLRHNECYGYLGKDDKRLPSAHACYTCLFNKEGDIRLLNELRVIALERRVIRLIETKRAINDVSLKTVLGKSVKDITNSLKTKGYLSDITKSVNKKKATHEWVFVSQKRNELMAKLFDPTYKVAHLLNDDNVIPTSPTIGRVTPETKFITTRLAAEEPDQLDDSAQVIARSQLSVQGRSPKRGRPGGTASQDSREVQVPRTPTSNRRKRSREEENDADLMDSLLGDPPKRRMRNSKAKEYLNVSGRS